jgi:hypothetical protein
MVSIILFADDPRGGVYRKWKQITINVEESRQQHPALFVGRRFWRESVRFIDIFRTAVRTFASA